MSNTIEYKGAICPFYWQGDTLKVFYQKSWVIVQESEVKAVK